MPNLDVSSVMSSGNKWLRQIIDSQIFEGFGGPVPKIIYGQEKFILGLKCFQKDEYSGIFSANNNTFESPVYSCKFGKSEETSSILGLAHEDGRIILQQTDGPNEGDCLTDKLVHGNAIFDLAWIPKKNEILTAAADLTVGLLSAEDLSAKAFFKGHTKCVKTVDANAWDTNVFASGGRDCNVFIWDLRCQPNNKANDIFGAHTIQKPHTNSPGLNRSCASQIQNSVISVLFRQQFSLLSAGASDGLIKVWDLRKTYSRGKREPQPLYTLEYSGSSSYRGYTSLCLSPHGEKVYVSCLDGKIYAYHLVNPTLKPVAEFYGHKPNTYYAKFCVSPCGSYLLSGSSDDQAYIWLTSCPGVPVASLTGHMDEVTCVAWSSRNLGTIVTCSDDMTHRIFKYKPMEQKDLEDPETKQELRGYAVPYQIKPNLVSITPKSQSDLNSCKNSDSVGKTTPLRQQVKNTDTGSHKSLFGLSHLQSATNSPLHCQKTPKQTQVRWTNEQVTPNTSGKKTLLSWLSSSKTPKEQSLLRTPTDERGLHSRITSKRKLADLMESSQENLHNEDQKPAVSPSKNVLEERQNFPFTTQPSNSVVKMLNYQSSDSKNESVEHSNKEVDNSVKLVVKKGIDYGDAPSKSLSNTCHHTSQPLITQPVHTVKTPAKALSSSDRNGQVLRSPNSVALLGSPTANLPNYVVDGRSPHNRQESPITTRRQADWLTSLTQKHLNAQESSTQAKKSIKRERVDVPRKRKSRHTLGKK